MNDRSYLSAVSSTLEAPADFPTLQYIHLEVRDHIGYIWLAKDEQNALDAEFLSEVVAAHDAMERADDVWGVIWGSKSTGFFSSGLDAAYMLDLERGEKIDIFAKFFETTRRVFAFTKPEIVIMPGHTFAAGAVLAMAADWRFMADTKARISFPEVMLGISMPSAMIAMLSLAAGAHNLSALIQTGDSFKSDEALRLGVVNAIMPQAELLLHAEKFMRRLFQKPLSGIRAVKKNLRRPVLEIFADDPSLEDFKDLMGANFEEALRAGLEGRRPKFLNP